MKTNLKKLIFDTTWGSGILAIIITLAALACWFGFSKISLGAYNEKSLTRQFLAEDSEVFKTIVIEIGTDTVARIIAGTSSMTRVGTSSYQYQPRIEYDGATGLWSFKNAAGTTTTAFGTVTAGYVATEIGSATASYVLKNSGSSTDQLATNATFAGVGTITANFTANGLVITPAEYASVNNATGEFETRIVGAAGTMSAHAHGGTDSVRISHNDVTGTGANSHATIDTFIASKGQASGIPSLTANSKVTQDPASGTSTPGANKIILSLATGKADNSWLSDDITKLGTPTTDNISEGSTNKYYTDARVNSAVGSLSINQHNDVNIVFNENDFVKIVGGQLVAGSSSATVAFSAVTGSATTNVNFSTVPGKGKVPVSSNDGKISWDWLGGVTGTFTTSISTGGASMDSASILLLHMDSINGTTTFANHGYGTMAITAQGNAQISTVNSKFGGSSGLFDGTGDYLTVATSPLLTIPAGSTWDFSVQINPDIVSDDDGIFAMGATTDSFFLMNRTSNIRMGMGTQTLTVASPATGVWTQVYVSYDGKIGRLFYNGTQQGTVTVSDTYIFRDNGEGVEIGAQSSNGYTYDGYLDEVRFRVSPATNFHTGNFTTDSVAYGGIDTYIENTLTLYEPNNNIPIIKFISPGTQTSEKSYAFLPGSLTVFGGTSTAGIGTTTPGVAYGVPGKGAATFDAFNVHSIDEIKTGVQNLEGEENSQRDKLLKMSSKSWHPKVRDAYILDAEAQAKEEYIRKGYTQWELVNKNNYISEIILTGTGSVQILDTEKMMRDFKTERELTWASDLNQPTLIKEKQDTLESDVSITRLGFMVHDPSTPKEIVEGEAINLMSVITLAVDSIKAQKAEIGSLEAIVGSITSEIEKLKVILDPR